MTRFRVGRKFVACLVLQILLTGVFMFLIFKTPWAVQPYTYAVYGVLIVTVGFANVGGNVWSKWTKSKHFRSELLDR